MADTSPLHEQATCNNIINIILESQHYKQSWEVIRMR
jgi:hypothetical protein